MHANRILTFIIGISAYIVIPLQIVTTLVLGLLVTISLGILLSPLSLIWAILVFPMIFLSRLTARYEWLRNPIGIVGIPWALLANIYAALMPSMGEMEGRAAKLMLAESWPYSWEFWEFQNGKIDLDDPEYYEFNEIVERISRRDPIKERTITRLELGMGLDSGM